MMLRQHRSAIPPVARGFWGLEKKKGALHGRPLDSLIEVEFQRNSGLVRVSQKIWPNDGRSSELRRKKGAPHGRPRGSLIRL